MSRFKAEFDPQVSMEPIYTTEQAAIDALYRLCLRRGYCVGMELSTVDESGFRRCFTAEPMDKTRHVAITDHFNETRTVYTNVIVPVKTELTVKAGDYPMLDLAALLAESR